MKIGVISAMESEHAQLAARLSEKKEIREGMYTYVDGMSGNNRVLLAQCGIGKVNAAVGALELIRRFTPHCVISTGVAGGIDTSLKVADVVAGARLVYHDVWCGEGNAYGQVQGMPPVFQASPVLLQHALALNAVGLENCIHGGLICTGDQFVTDYTALGGIKKHFPDGLAVDMESAAIAHVCHLCQVPFLSFRIISDTPGVDNHWEQYTGFWRTMAERSFLTVWAFLTSLPETLQPLSYE